ncbi:ABC transporter substrate-binding protein [Halobacteria archaeon AArc-curdl1]|uniref:ABC transporter substrate-binding protein n=1 Tax=Natronosalvus hydrolyticus TaxID=2979988 RepID=A0AAP2Z8M8_9EURY|nr:ABC transporter substrate-binding protein [Halobacteria archaeon AArc-curdl1]
MGDDDGDGNGADDAVVEDPDGDPVEEITLLSLAQGDAPARYEYGQMIQDNLEELGFEVEYDPKPINQYVESRQEDPFPWDMMVRRAGDGYEPAEAIFRRFFHSSNIGDGGSNMYGYENSEVDDLLAQQRGEMDPDARTEIIHDLQEILREDMPIVPLLIQERAMPFNSDKFQNPTVMLEDGIGCFWNFLNMEPTGDDAHLRTSMAEDLTTLNPLMLVNRGDREMIRLIYDRLMRVTPDIEVEPWAAESVEAVDDTTIEITLREGMTFHDGEPVTVDDVKFSYEYAEEESPEMASRLEVLDSIDVESDTELVFHLEQPSAPFFENALARILILPEHIWENVPEDVDAESAIDWDNPDAIGSGPFQVVSTDLGEELQLSAFEDHFNPPNVDRVTRAVIADMRAGIRAYEDGALDMLSWELPFDDISRFEQRDDTNLSRNLMTSIHHIGFNHRNTPFDDAETRNALAHAIPQEDIVDAIYGGTAQEIHNPMSSGFDTWYWNDVPQYDSNVSVAREKLAEAGYEWDTDGRIHQPPE